MTLDDIDKALAGAGLRHRGGFHPEPADGVPGNPKTLVLVGNAGPAMWRAFAAAVPAEDRHRSGNPLDDWTAGAVGIAARALGADALYPFAGPPYLPFQAWALRAGGVFRSPIGPLIHPEFGLWHAYRGALAFADRLDLPAAGGASPCETCADKPCLGACPVGAFEPVPGEAVARYDVPACVAHVAGAGGAECRDGGCLARRACPIGRDYAYRADQAAFHMARFVAAQGGDRP